MPAVGFTGSPEEGKSVEAMTAMMTRAVHHRRELVRMRSHLELLKQSQQKKQAPDPEDERSWKPVQSKIRASLFAAHTLNAAGQSRVTLSPR